MECRTYSYFDPLTKSHSEHAQIFPPLLAPRLRRSRPLVECAIRAWRSRLVLVDVLHGEGKRRICRRVLRINSSTASNKQSNRMEAFKKFSPRSSLLQKDCILGCRRVGFTVLSNRIIKIQKLLNFNFAAKKLYLGMQKCSYLEKYCFHDM